MFIEPDERKLDSDRKNYLDSATNHELCNSNSYHVRTKSTDNNFATNNFRFSNSMVKTKLGTSRLFSDRFRSTYRSMKEKSHPILDEKQKRERQFAYENFLKQTMPLMQKARKEEKNKNIIKKEKFFIPGLIQNKSVEKKKKIVEPNKTMPNSESIILDNRKKLLENYEMSLIKSNEKEKEKEISHEKDKTKKKLKYLNEKGRLENLNNFEMENDDDKYLNDMFEKETKKSKNFMRNSNPNLRGGNNLFLRNSSNSYNGSKVFYRGHSVGSSQLNRADQKGSEITANNAKKPKLDSFDFIKKIGINVINIKSYEMEDLGNEKENSFRKSFNNKIQKINNPDHKLKKIDDNQKESKSSSNRLYKTDSKKLEASDEETRALSFRKKNKVIEKNKLKVFIDNSKKKIKEEKIKFSNEATERNMKIYFNLLNLQEKTSKRRISNQLEQKDEDDLKRNLMIESDRISFKKNSKMIKNDSYIGLKQKKASKNVDSSIIDDEYYLKQMCDFNKKVLSKTDSKKKRLRSVSSENVVVTIKLKSSNNNLVHNNITDNIVETEKIKKELNVNVQSENNLNDINKKKIEHSNIKNKTASYFKGKKKNLKLDEVKL